MILGYNLKYKKLGRNIELSRKDYVNSISAQVMDLAGLADLQSEKCFDLDKWRSVIDPARAEQYKKVIIVGCGDSYSAAGVTVPAIKELAGIEKVFAPDIMDFCRFYSENKILRGLAKEEVLVCAISFSGSAERVAEALTKAGNLGIDSILITRNPESKGAKAAKYVFNVDTPDGLNTPGLRSYYANMVGIFSMAAYIGVCKGCMTEEKFVSYGKEVSKYTADFMADIDAIDEQAFAFAEKVKDLEKFEVIADYNEGYSGQFVEQKFIECSGVFCDHTNSEEYAHISMMLRQPYTFGMIIMVNAADRSLSRMKDTINGNVSQRRPTLVVTDCDPDIFTEYKVVDASKIQSAYKPKGEVGSTNYAEINREFLNVLRVVKAPYQWMSPLMDFIPGSLVAGYHAVLNGRNFFAGRYDALNMKWIG